jgi:hypothetical protein
MTGRWLLPGFFEAEEHRVLWDSLRQDYCARLSCSRAVFTAALMVLHAPSVVLGRSALTRASVGHLPSP